jgi:hypothetical protein
VIRSSGGRRFLSPVLITANGGESEIPTSMYQSNLIDVGIVNVTDWMKSKTRNKVERE